MKAGPRGEGLLQWRKGGRATNCSQWNMRTARLVVVAHSEKKC